MKKRIATSVLALLLSVGASLLVSWSAWTSGSVFARSVTGHQVVQEAKTYLHDRYSYTGDSPKTGFSCIGFVSYVFRNLGIDMPGDLQDAMAAYPQVPERSLHAGDIIFFQNTWWKGVSHIAIYMGRGKIIHAENPRRGVTISDLSHDPKEGNYWQQHYLIGERALPGSVGGSGAYKRVIGTGTVTVATLNLRAYHSLRSPVRTVLKKEIQLAVHGWWRGWLKVQLAGGVSGWVVKGGVSVHWGPGRQPSGSEGTSGKIGTHGSASIRGRRAMVDVHGLHLRSQPSLKARVIETLHRGQKVRVLKERAGWCRIMVIGVKGWSVAEGLKLDTSRPPRKGTSHSSGQRSHKVYGVLLITAHLRAHPSLSAKILRSVKAGTRLTILGTVPQWDHVRLPNKKTGYIYSEYVKG